MSKIFISPQSSEPDSHNEFEVSTEEPEVDKPRLVVPLTPMEKENALVTLLDPTAVPDDEMKTVTGGMAESTDHPSASEDITDKSEAIYVSESEPSNDRGEEELPIITHEIETIHHNETGELVRDYIPTPLVNLGLETDAPYISLSPNQISEEDLTPIDENIKTPSLDVTPTTQVLLTTAPAEEELSDLRLPVTTLSAITGQPPTEPAVNLQEDEEVNALPDEEELGLAVPEPYSPNEDVSELVPEDELLVTDGELVVQPEEELEVLQTTSEQTDVSEPEKENVEVSEPDTEEKEVGDISEPEEVVVENQEDVAVTQPEETEKKEHVEDSRPVQVLQPEDSKPEAEPDDSTVEILTGGGVEVLQPGEEIVEITESVKVISETDLDEVSHPDPGSEKDEIESLERGPEPDVASEFGGDVDVVSEPEEKVVVVAGSQETVPEVPEAPEAVDVEQDVEEEEVAVAPIPEDEDVESEEKVVTILEVEEKSTEVTAGELDLLQPESAPSEKSHVPELTKTGTEESETAEEKHKGVAEPSETLLEDVDHAQEPESGKKSEASDAPKIPQPEEEKVEDAKQEEEVTIAPAPDEEPVDISETQLPPEDRAEQGEVVENPEPEEASEPGEDTVDDLSPAEKIPGLSEPESNEEVVVDVPELNSEQGTVVSVEPETKRDITEPPAESIKILHPSHDVENLHFGEETIQVVEDNSFLQPVEPDYHHPVEEDNLPVIPTGTQPFDDNVNEADHEYPIIEDLYTEEDVDSIDIQVESDTGAVMTTEVTKSDLQFETSSDNAGEQDSIALQSMKYN